MLKYLNLFTGLLILSAAYGQTATIYTEDFETGMTGWNAADDLTPNYWISNSCAGNGTTSPGTNSMYITIGGAVAGCGATGDIQYAYSNSPSGTQVATQHITVDATCASDLIIEFDYKIDGVVSEDYGELVYSTNGGSTWVAVGSPLTQSSGWTSAILPLGAGLNFSTFELGFRFYYNDATVTGSPLAVDNIVITGTDTAPPVMTCPLSVDQPVQAGSCTAICDDYTKDILTLSDNCTDSAFIVLTQDIPEFTVFGAGPGGTESITVTATDEAGNSTQCTFTINIIDDVFPINTCPADTNVYVDSNCDGLLEDYTGDVTMGDNCTSAANLIVTQSPPPGTVIPGSMVTTSVTITVTDESGNATSCQFNAITVDTIVATIICPADTSVYANGSCQGTLSDYTGDAIVNDNCVPSSSLTVTQSPVPGTTITANQVITLTVSGAVPNIDQSCTFNGIFVDTVSPQVVCPSQTTLYSDNSCEATIPDYTGAAVATDNCTAVPGVTQNPPAGTIVTSEGPVTITLTTTDGSGNTGLCQFTQQVLDTVSPVATCPSDQTEIADMNCQVSLPDYTSMVTGSDNCSSILNYMQSPAPGTTITTSTAVTMTVTDGSGNSSTCSFNSIPDDQTAPTITCPATTTVNTDSGCSYILADFTGSATAADNCTAAGSLVYTQNPVPGSNLSQGTITITIDVTDQNSNSAQCTFDLVVADQVNPVITTCPPNQNLIADVACSAVLGDYTGAAVASDNCTSTGNLILSQTPVPGALISSTTSVTFTVEDESGNTATCNFNAIIVDTTSPSVTCPNDQNIDINSSCEYTMPDLTGMVSGTDNCSALGNMTITQNPAAGTTQNGITAVLITLTDENGNQSTCFTNMLPNDTVTPTITCPSFSTINNGTACDYVLQNYGSMALVLDNCSDYTIDQSPAPTTVVQTGTNTITLTVTDAGGNTDQCSFDLVITESVAPTITCPADISTCDPMVTYSLPVFGDNCAASMSQTDMTGLSSGMNFPVGVTTLEYTAIDSSGNTQSCTFNVEILDFPSSANIVDDTLFLCEETSAIVNADPITSGSGEWTVVSGSGSFNNQFANTTGVNNVGIGTNVYAWTVSSASCGTLSDTLVVVNYQQDLTASTQDTVYACLDGSVTLVSNTPLYGTGVWTTNGGGVIANVNSSNTSSTVSGGGWLDFIWTITNGTCPPSSDTLRVFAIDKPSIDQNDTIVCLESDVIMLSGSDPYNSQTPVWSVISGFAVIEDPNSVSTLAHDFELGTTLITYSFEHDVCPTVYDTISVSGNLCQGFDPVIPTVITPGNIDGKNDVFVIDFLDDVYPECHVVIFNRWGSVVFESTGYSEPWDGTYKGEYLPMGTYFYRIELNDGSGEILKGDISIIH